MRLFWFGPSKYQIQLDRIELALRRLEQRTNVHFTNLERMQAMADVTLDDILADTTAENTEIAALAALAAGIKSQLDQALSGQTLSPASQAKINSIFANIEKNKEALSAAILANTASGPAATVTPTPIPVAAEVTPTTAPAPADGSGSPAPTPVA